jgi:hypothetical protein
LHNDNCPDVRAIYKVVSTRANVTRYEQYLSVSPPAATFTFIDARGYSNRVEMERNFASEGEHRGNERSRWHGTTRKCKIGDKGVTRFCVDGTCSLCCIMRSSFDLRFFGKKTNFGRFGAGIYTSATSSKFVHMFVERVEVAV